LSARIGVLHQKWLDTIKQSLSTMPADLPTVKVASLIHHGAYNTLNQSYQIVLKWVEPNGYQVDGPIREIYLHYEDTVRQDDDSYVPEIQVPIAKV
jgi:effector-binding domain-containing protein